MKAIGSYHKRLICKLVALLLFSSVAPHAIRSQAAGTWTSIQVGAGSQSMWRVAVGQGRNDGMDRVYGSNKDGHIYEFSYSGNQWLKSDPGAPGDWEMRSVVVGTGRYDGAKRVYGIDVNYVKEYTFSGGQWNHSASYYGWHGEDVAIGAPRGEGTPGVYVSSIADNKVVELTYSKGSFGRYEIPTTTSAPFRRVAVGDGRNDGRVRMYATHDNGNVYEYSYANGAWTEAAITVVPSPLHAIVIGSGRKDGISRVYVGCTDGHVYELSYESGNWVKADLGYGGYSMSGVALGAGRNDGVVRVYGANTDKHAYEFTYSSGSWTKVDLGSGGDALYGIAVGNGRSDGQVRVYASCGDGKIYEFSYTPPSAERLTVVGLGSYANSGGWFDCRGGASTSFASLGLGRLPWAGYNATGGGMHPALGDVDGDGLDEVVLGLGPGSFGWMAVLDDAAHDYALLQWLWVNWGSYDSANGEVFPAVGDLDGDGRAEIVAGLGTGSQGWVEIFDDASAGYQHLAWKQVAWPAYNATNGTTHPAVGDLDGDGKAEIVLGLGNGSSGWLEVLKSAAGSYEHSDWLQVGYSSYVSQNVATFPAVGDIDGDGRAEMVLGLGHGGGGWMEILQDAVAGYTHVRWLQIPWAAYNAAVGEIHPAVGDIDGDARVEIILGLARFTGAGGWLCAFDDVASGHGILGWFQVAWTPFNQDGGETFPAIGKLR